MLIKKIACLLLASIMMAQPMVAQAVDLNGAFTNLMGDGAAVSINSPGRFQSSARSGFSGGGIEMRVPRGANVPQLFSASPPRIVAGCNGISAHFGGFSFISGAEFGSLLKQIASGAALGFVSSLVMKTLCPACEAVVQELKTAAQSAARLAKDSCEIGRKYGADAAAGLGYKPDEMSLCSNTDADGGGSGDTLASYKSVCTSIVAANTRLTDFNAKSKPDGTPLTPKEKAAADAKGACAVDSGNRTWARLTAFDGAGIFGTKDAEGNARRLMLINLLGAELHVGAADEVIACENGDSTTSYGTAVEVSHYCKPPADAALFTNLFMCGAGGADSMLGASSRIAKYCKSTTPGNVPPKVWTCKNPQTGVSDFVACPYLSKVDPSEVFKGEGFLLKINKLLRAGVSIVREGKSFDSPEGRAVIALIQVAPYPLYQAINAAAVYPAAADDLLDSMSVLVSENYTHALFNEMLRLEGRSSSAACISPKQATQLLDFVGALRSQNTARFALIAQDFSIQQGVSEQIRQINLAIQRQVMSEDLLASGRMSQAINSALTPTGSGQGAPVPSASTKP